MARLFAVERSNTHVYVFPDSLHHFHHTGLVDIENLASPVRTFIPEPEPGVGESVALCHVLAGRARANYTGCSQWVK